MKTRIEKEKIENIVTVKRKHLCIKRVNSYFTRYTIIKKIKCLIKLIAFITILIICFVILFATCKSVMIPVVASSLRIEDGRLTKSPKSIVSDGLSNSLRALLFVYFLTLGHFPLYPAKVLEW